MYSLTADSTTITNISSVPRALSNEDISILNKLSHLKNFSKAKISSEDDCKGEPTLDKKTRESSIFWIRPELENESIKTIFRKISSTIIDVNHHVFEYILTDIEAIQFSRYDVGEFYGRHIDTQTTLALGATCRKLSFSIQLSDPSEYDGGNLLIHSGSKPLIASKEKGSMTIFSSFMLHEVEPVTRGTRNALVGWCWGPKFK